MCRLAAVTSRDYISPMEPILALEAMKEGHDGSGLGLTLKDLGGEFEELKGNPILSGIASQKGATILDNYMEKLGFRLKHEWNPAIKEMKGIVPREYYFAKVYEYPKSYRDKPMQDKEGLLLNTR